MKYVKVRCPRCGGHGVVSVYSHDDFEGPGDCPGCKGAGWLCIYESDRVALYPGGPLMGSWPGEYKRVSATEPTP